MSMEEFLGHSTRDSGGNYLENWKKKRTPPQIDTFIHTKSHIVAVWQHPWPKLVQRKDDNTGVTTVEVWGSTFNSWETEAMLRKQYHRDPKVLTPQGVAGPRVLEPVLCPMSLMLEAIHTAIREKRLNWCEEVFRFTGTDPTKSKVLHAGGLFNAYGHKDVTDKMKAEVAAAGISPKFAWMENQQAKCNYIFTIVDAENPGVGPQVTTETTLLGDKVKALIKDKMTANVCATDPTGTQGNPIVNPYCIRWVHQPNATTFSDYYKAIIMEKIKVTDAIQAAFDEDAPDVSYLARRGNIKKLRDSMESAYVGPDNILDFDRIFAPSEKVYATQNPESTAEEAEKVMEQAAAVKTRRREDADGKLMEKELQEADAEDRAPGVTTEADLVKEDKPKRKRRTKKEMDRDKREKGLLAKVDDMSESDLLAALDEDGHTTTFISTLQERLESVQSSTAKEIEPELEAKAETGVEMFACDKCEKPMRGDVDTCPHCGAKYNLDTGELVPEETSKPRRRSAAKSKGGESGDRIDF